jgi:hypothetical protein
MGSAQILWINPKVGTKWALNSARSGLGNSSTPMRANLDLSRKSRLLPMVCEAATIPLFLNRERGGRFGMNPSETPLLSFGACRNLLGYVNPARNPRWRFPILTTTASFRKGYTKPLRANYLNDSVTFEAARGALNSPTN